MKVLPLYFFAFLFFLTSCGSRRGQFKIEGRFLHINQGELYVYSPDGGLQGLDTIRIQAGRFAYETKMDQDATLMLVFPNFSEHPVFAESGGSVEVKADASHLKEMTVDGTKENKLMNKFRKLIINASPPDETKYATQFIEDHPESRVSTYLLRKYFLQSVSPDYKEALRLVGIMHKSQPDNGNLVRLQQRVQSLTNSVIGRKLPSFSSIDVNGNKVSDADFRTGVAVISVWSTRVFESQGQQRILRDLRKTSGGKLKLLSISVDPSKQDCLSTLKRDEIEWPNVCDEKMMDGQLLQQLGLATMPDNIIVVDGKIVEHTRDINTLKSKLENLLE
ncbi:MAG: DUF4369 domain-containing protein [Prevotella sp.]|nr:DUF4369 domain-containing protein [Prevotella sp.]